MASINVSEDDFMTIACAAMESGNRANAQALDKIARKINAALTNEKARKSSPFGRMCKAVTWREMPSTLEHGS